MQIRHPPRPDRSTAGVLPCRRGSAYYNHAVQTVLADRRLGGAGMQERYTPLTCNGAPSTSDGALYGELRVLYRHYTPNEA